MTTTNPKLKHWTENMGLEPEEALALLLMLSSLNGHSGEFSREIELLQDMIANREVEKMLGETHE